MTLAPAAVIAFAWEPSVHTAHTLPAPVVMVGWSAAVPPARFASREKFLPPSVDRATWMPPVSVLSSR
ncbi:hypothetical protein GCM10010276_80890 [Streptomyces longisporus]|uniref:Secreted protein n=1 Tax=Streptomyces longisporus TaxID=1948 RepID=A0ABP6AME8_STRLO